MQRTLLVWLVLATGCAVTPGSGVEATETRDVDPFLGVHVHSGIRAEIIVGEPRVLSVRADDNLLELLETGIADDALFIHTTAGVDRVVPAEVSLGNDRLEFLSAREPGSVALAHRIDADRFGVAASDGAAVQVGGVCQTLAAIASDDAHLDARSLRCGDIRVDVQGGSIVEVTASGRVEVHASGESLVIVHGDPTEVVEFLTDNSVLVREP